MNDFKLPENLPDPPWDIFTINRENLKSIKRHIDKTAIIEDNVIIKGDVYIGKNTIIRSGSYITGKVFIGNNCEIGCNSLIKGVTFIEHTARVRFSSEVRCSIIRSGAMVDHISYIGDSYIGRNCNIGAGTMIANQRYDYGEIFVRYNNKKINTHKKFLGVIMNDDCKTSVNCSINCGSIIPPNTIVEGNYGYKRRW